MLDWENTMMRGLLVTVATAGVIAGAAVGVAPAAGADPLNGDCIAERVNSDGSCYYSSCAEAREAGECDIPAGDDHYCSKRDGDDVICS